MQCAKGFYPIFKIMFLRFSDQVKMPLVPDWADQELKQGSCSRRNGVVEGWFPLSDQSGISCNLMESMRFVIFHSFKTFYFIYNII